MNTKENLENLELTLNGNSIKMDLPTLQLKNSLIYTLLFSNNPTENIESEIDRIENDIHVLEGVIILIENSGKSFQIITSSENPTETLMNEFNLTENQVNVFLNLDLKDINLIDFNQLKINLQKTIVFLRSIS